MNLFCTGVDHSIPGNGGPDCVNYSSYRRRILESSFALTFAFGEIYYSWRKLRYPVSDYIPRDPNHRYDHITYFRRCLIAFLCLVFGIEIGFKFSSQTLIYILNPCHMVTIIQIFLLLCDPHGKAVTFFFRFHVYTLAGAFLALIFPVLNTRLLPMEADLYYVQHYAILLIPFYLMTYGGEEKRIEAQAVLLYIHCFVIFVISKMYLGSFSAENFWDPWWFVMFTGILFVYHFFFLHLLGVYTMVNLNNMVCPAITDPFRGPYYRLCALIHQSLFIPLYGKLYFAFGQFLLRTLGVYPEGDVATENGHVVANGSTPVDDSSSKGHSD